MPWHTMPKQGLSCVLLICWITLAHCTTCVHKIYCDPGCEGSCTGYNRDAKLVFRNVLTRKSFKLHILERKGFISRGSSGVCLLLQDLLQSCSGLRNYFVWQNCGGVQVQVLEFLHYKLEDFKCLEHPDAAPGKAPASNGHAPRRRAPPRRPHNRRGGQRVRIQELEIHTLSWRMHATAVGCQGIGRHRLHRVAAPLPWPPCSHPGVLECSTRSPDGHCAASLRPGWGRW